MSRQRPGAPGALVGVDVGGSGVRVRVRAGQAHPGTDVEGRSDVPIPRTRGQVDVPQLCANVLGQVQPLMARLGAERAIALAVGITGLPGLVPDPGRIARTLRAQVRVGAVVIAGDALTTHVGALAGQPGAVVAAGTGVIALGTNHRDVWHQVDGWGLFVGDEGGGAWIGRRGLRAALRSVDGRPEGSAVLADRMRERFGEPLALVAAIHGAEAPAALLASFAPAVAQAAREGDALARQIWVGAGHRLAGAAAAAVGDLPARISWGGGLFDAGDLLTEAFHAGVHRHRPGAQVLPPQGSALDGAVLLAARAAAGDLRPHPPYLQVFPD
ncbi:N-acetylglucosamine kinase [Pseudactinotalea sp. Z1748]|uniref:N-acetylglucosamine kinase n=1 Tax=Pseudactinotalea sp. Z1748 TaxID=3413027 RepID=UPI003C7B549F